MSNPQYELAKDAVKDALRIGMKYRLSEAATREKIREKLRGIGAEVVNGGLIPLTVRENGLQASLSVKFPATARVFALNVQKQGNSTAWLATRTQKQAIDVKLACELIRSLQVGDKVRIVFANDDFDGDLAGRIMMLLGGFRDTADFGGDGMGMMNLMAVAQSGRWEGFRTYTMTVLEGFDAEYFVSRTIGRSLLESIEKIA